MEPRRMTPFGNELLSVEVLASKSGLTGRRSDGDGFSALLDVVGSVRDARARRANASAVFPAGQFGGRMGAAGGRSRDGPRGARARRPAWSRPWRGQSAYRRRAADHIGD